MAGDLKLACVFGLSHTVHRKRCIFGGCIVTGSLEAEICSLASIIAGSLVIMSHPERCVTEKVLSSRYAIQSNGIVHCFLIMPCDLLIMVVSVFISLALGSMH